MVLHHDRFAATTYHIYVSVAKKDYSFFIESEDAAGRPVTPYRKVSTLRWMIARKSQALQETGRRYRESVRIRGMQVPGKRVSYALALLMASARGAVAYAQNDYRHATEFYICSTKNTDHFEATMYLDRGRTVAVKTATGSNHLEAMRAIMQRFGLDEPTRDAEGKLHFKRNLRPRPSEAAFNPPFEINPTDRMWSIVQEIGGLTFSLFRRVTMTDRLAECALDSLPLSYAFTISLYIYPTGGFRAFVLAGQKVHDEYSTMEVDFQGRGESDLDALTDLRDKMRVLSQTRS
ncbi:hypothetical protein CC80DRAFT_544437 [Byssothecium circinans]|uniref:Uncharacterized protein n=1 Tax=Byssothecium circinans TaxID=147558 RepID=A0A6A5U9P1_9PLEO|nr:hypothetical protein CC80DRAFT_544437 [Byssothecium circinans]